MKVFIFICLILILFPYQGATPDENRLIVGEESVDNSSRNINTIQDSLSENDIFNSDPDILAIRPQQRSLPELKKRDKIIWSFKMAKKNIFL